MPQIEDSATGTEDAEEAGTLLALLWRVNHEIETLSKRMIQVMGVTSPQRMVLRIVAGTPGVTARAIADTAQIDASTLTGMLKRLERGGLLVRSRDDDDGRKAHFLVTAGGQQIADAQRGTVESALIASLTGVPAAEREAVRRWLTGFADALVEQQSAFGNRQRVEK